MITERKAPLIVLLLWHKFRAICPYQLSEIKDDQEQSGGSLRYLKKDIKEQLLVLGKFDRGVENVS